MKIVYSADFEKALIKLSFENYQKVKAAIRIFKKNPLHPKLKNHRLRYDMKKYRSFSADDDLRIVYREIKNHVTVHMIDVGTHEQVYKS